MERKRDRIVFMGSYYDGLIDLEGEDFENVTKALLRYMFCDELPTLTGIQNSLFMSFKANVDISKAKSDSGKKGGMASWKSRSTVEAEPKQNEGCLKQSRSTVEAEPKQSRTTRLDKTRLDKTRLDETGLEETRQKKADKRPFDQIEDPELKEAALGFREMRKSIRKPLTARGEQLMLSKLEKIAKDECGMLDVRKGIEIFDASTENGWLGLFPLKGDTTTNTKTKKRDIFAELDALEV